MKLTDAEWRDFQSIPDQGYSHRGWIDFHIAKRVTEALEELAAEIAGATPYGWEMNPDGSEDRLKAAYVEGHHDAWAVIRGQIDAIQKEK